MFAAEWRLTFLAMILCVSRANKKKKLLEMLKQSTGHTIIESNLF